MTHPRPRPARLAAALLCAALPLAGCIHIDKVSANSVELRLMPTDVALQLIRKHIPSADKTGLAVPAEGVCTSYAPKWFAYADIQRASFQQGSRYVPSTARFAPPTNPLALCASAIKVHGLSRDEALELTGALNAMGARIEALSAF